MTTRNPHKCADCDTIIYGKAKRCEPHRKARKKQTRNAYMAAERKEYKGIKKAGIKDSSHKCADCPTIITGTAERCEPCKVARKMQTDREYHQREQQLQRKSVYALQEKPRPRKKVKIVKTSAQVHRELIKEDQRLAETYQRLNHDLLAQRLLRGAVV